MMKNVLFLVTAGGTMCPHDGEGEGSNLLVGEEHEPGGQDALHQLRLQALGQALPALLPNNHRIIP